jgi:hypothetical protein
MAYYIATTSKLVSLLQEVGYQKPFVGDRLVLFNRMIASMYMYNSVVASCKQLHQGK